MLGIVTRYARSWLLLQQYDENQLRILANPTPWVSRGRNPPTPCRRIEDSRSHFIFGAGCASMHTNVFIIVVLMFMATVAIADDAHETSR